MNRCLLLISLALAGLLLSAAPAVAATVDGTWTNTTGRFTVLVLHERAAGRLTGYLPDDPATWITGGLHSGAAVTINLAGKDPLLAWSGAFTGTLAGRTLTGTFDDGSGPVTITAERTARRLTVEHWILAGGPASDMVRATKVLLPSGAFASGGFVGVAACDFLACGGSITAWTVAGTAHTIATASGGTYPSTSSLTGTWDPATRLLSGSYATTHCLGSASGTFFGGKAGLTDTRDIRRVLELLGDFADRIEAESPAAADAFASFYLNDGMTRADWQAKMAAIYAAYDNLEARIDGVRQIVTQNDSEVHPFVSGPPRVEWHLIVTGAPAGGGPRVTVLDVAAAPRSGEALYWIGEEHGRAVFIGNGYAAPFSIIMPILPGDAARAFTGLWPFGVHGGGHPEGHRGWDVEYAAGAKARAAADGTVSDIEPNSLRPDLSRVTVEHRPGYHTVYDDLDMLEPDIVVGARVRAGDPLSTVGGFSSGSVSHFHSTFSVRIGLDDVCPGDYLNADGRSVFDTIWPGARYMEELAEPFPCNPVAATFPLTRAWLRTSGSLAPRIELTRLDPTTTAYAYTLRDGLGTAIESGSIVINPFASPHPTIDLLPVGGGAPHLGIYDVVSGTMRIAWDDATRPTTLTSASEHTLTP